MDKKIFGGYGEALAYNYLKKKKYKILERNFTCEIGELDIVAEKKDVVVFVEVKTRASAKLGLPREAVNFYKQQKIKQLALYYLKCKNWLERNVRFDVIDILNGEITHIENAF